MDVDSGAGSPWIELGKRRGILRSERCFRRTTVSGEISDQRGWDILSDLEFQSILSALNGMRHALRSPHGENSTGVFRDFARSSDCLYNLLTKE
jgi:hypothetical protein